MKSLLEQSQIYNRQMQKLTLKRFNQYSKISAIMTKVYSRLLSTSAGKIFLLITKWKNLPERKNDEKIARCIKFEKILAGKIAKCLQCFMAPIKGLMYEGEAVKKSAIRNLLVKTMSQNKRMFLKWHKTAEIYKNNNICAKTI